MASPLNSVADLRMTEGHDLSKDIIKAHVNIIESRYFVIYASVVEK